MTAATRGCLAACACLALCMVSGCATDPNEEYFMETETHANVFVAPNSGDIRSGIRKVALLPFKAPTELIGNSVSDMFVTEMLKAGRYELVERGQMSQVLSETELALAGLSAAKAAEVGSMMGADAVMIGTVDEYGTQAYKGHAYPVVGVTVRLIDCKSGKILWSADLGERASSKDATLATHARQVVHQITSALYQNWKKNG